MGRCAARCWFRFFVMPRNHGDVVTDREVFGGRYAALLDDRSMAAVERTRATRLDLLRAMDPVLVSEEALEVPHQEPETVGTAKKVV